MKGLQLCRAYYGAFGEPMLKEKFPEAVDRIAVGLVGPGSECFGFDDEISRDHDWGPSFCLWLKGGDAGIRERLTAEYAALPDRFLGFGPRVVSPGEEHRVGPCDIGDFFESSLGIRHIPETNAIWLCLGEQPLATCTNGQVWEDPLGEFSRWRAALLAFYPEDVRLKKIASRCITISQSGQYNFLRCTKRGQQHAARYCEVQFCADVISLVFLLNKRYTPYFKWSFLAVAELSVLGAEIASCLDALLQLTIPAEKDHVMQEICERLSIQMFTQGLTDSRSTFLMDHVAFLYDRIYDPELRRRVEVVR